MQADSPKLEDRIKEQIIEIIKKWLKLPHYRVFYFGSRVAGKGGERSDIDIGIEAPEPIPGGAMTQIRWELDELPILQKIDVVDFKTVSKEFKEVALQNIEVIYEQ